jgi:hypothetical protein
VLAATKWLAPAATMKSARSQRRSVLIMDS